MLNYFRPKAGSYGVQLVALKKSVGALTANVTNTVSLGGIGRLARIHSIHVSARVIPVDADGTLVITAKKRDASAAANITLTDGTFNLENLVASATTSLAFAAATTDFDKLCEPGDTVYVEVVSNSAAIDTQATDLEVVVILEVIQ